MIYSEDKVRKEYRNIDKEVLDRILKDGFGEALDYYDFGAKTPFEEARSNYYYDVYDEKYDEDTKTFSFKISSVFDERNLDDSSDFDWQDFEFNAEERYVESEDEAWKISFDDRKIIEFADGSKFCATVNDINVAENSVEITNYDHQPEQEDSPEFTDYDIDGELIIEISVSIQKVE